MSAETDGSPTQRTVSVNGHDCRIWEKGQGPRLGYLAGLKGCPRWPPFLDHLATQHQVVVPSLPGFPGAPSGHHELDDLADWVAMTLDLLERAELEGAPLVGASVGGKLAAEVAAFSPRTVDRLVLIAPYGLYDEAEPPTMFFASTAAEQPELLAADPEAYAAFTSFPDPQDEAAMMEWEMEAFRAAESSARLLWPFGDRGLVKRLHRIRCPTLVVWGAEDRIFPASYADRFCRGITGPAVVKTVAGAGHLAEIDRPDEVAQAVLSFLAEST